MSSDNDVVANKGFANKMWFVTSFAPCTAANRWMYSRVRMSIVKSGFADTIDLAALVGGESK